MRIATETVWATADGKLVAAGDANAAVLVAAKGHAIPLKKLEQFGKQADKFFKDATFDRHGGLELPKPLKQAAPVTLSRLDTSKDTKSAAEAEADAAAKRAKGLESKREDLNEAPAPQNREDSVHKKLRKRKK